MDQPEVQKLLADCRSGDPHTQIVALIELIKLHDESVVLEISPLLASPDEEVRAETARALGYLGYAQRERLGPDLLKLLDDTEWHVRDEAALALGSLLYSPAIERLKYLLHHDPHWIVRASVAEALGAFSDDSILPHLEQVLRDKKEETPVQTYAAASMGEIASPAYRPTLDAFLKRTRAFNVRSALLAASYRLGGHEHLEPLLAMLEAADEDDATVALQSIQNLTGQKVPPTLLADAPRIREVLETIPQRWPLTGPQVREILANLEQLEKDKPPV